MKGFQRIALISITCGFLAIAVSGTAAAGTYKVYSCAYPDGRIAPTTGWAATEPAAGVRYDLSCLDGSGIGVALDGNRTYPSGFFTGIDLKIPSDLRVAALATKDSMTASAYSTVWMVHVGYWGQLPGEPEWRGLGGCGGGPCPTSYGYEPIFNSLSPAVQAIRIGVDCLEWRGDCPAGSVGSISAASLQLTVDDRHRPRFAESPSGSLSDTSAVSQLRELNFSVADRGGGLAQAVLQVPGVPTQTKSLRGESARCRPPYGYVVPCPASAQGQFEIDTSSMAPGDHLGRLTISDVAGNELTHEFPIRIPAPIPPASPNVCASVDGFVAKTRPRTVRYGRREKLRLSIGRDVEAQPGALIVAGEAADHRPLAHARAVARHYVATLRLRRPRTLRLALPTGDGRHQCSTPLNLAVRANLRLRIKPRSVSNGDSIRFNGRLLGGNAAASRAIVVQARAKGGPKRWTPVRVLRTDRRGRFTMRYTFRRTYSRVRFEFRAAAKPEPDSPFVGGASPVRSVLVRG